MLVDRAVDACERHVNRAALGVGARFRSVAQGRVQECNRFREVARVIEGQAELHAELEVGFRVELPPRLRLFIQLDNGERVVEAPFHRQRCRKRAACP